MSDPSQKVTPTSVSSRVGSSRRRVSSTSGTKDFQIGKRHFQRADPLVSSLDLESTLLPVGLVFDVRFEHHLALSWDIIHNDIEDG